MIVRKHEKKKQLHNRVYRQKKKGTHRLMGFFFVALMILGTWKIPVYGQTVTLETEDDLPVNLATSGEFSLESSAPAAGTLHA